MRIGLSHTIDYDIDHMSIDLSLVINYDINNMSTNFKSDNLL